MTEPTDASTRERKLRQIQTLLDLASDERTPEGEREVAMNRAMALMAAHGVTEMMVDARKRDQTDEIETRVIRLKNPYSHEKMLLLNEIATSLNCRIRYNYQGRTVTRVFIYGFRSDLARVELLYTSLLLQAVNAVSKARPDWGWVSAAETRRFRRNFLVSFGQTVGIRLWQAEKAAREKYDRENTNTEAGTELVLVSRRKRVENFYDADVADIKFNRASRARYGGDGDTEGAQAGRKADLGGGTGVATAQRPALPSVR